jgi:hypothetical protein
VYGGCGAQSAERTHYSQVLEIDRARMMMDQRQHADALPILRNQVCPLADTRYRFVVCLLACSLACLSPALLASMLVSIHPVVCFASPYGLWLLGDTGTVQVARLRSEGWDLLFARAVALIAECERVLCHRADLVKSCMELLDPRVCIHLCDADVASITGQPVEVQLAAPVPLPAISTALAAEGPSLASTAVCDRLCTFLASTAKSISVDLVAGRVDFRLASPSGWHSRNLGSPAFPLPTDDDDDDCSMRSGGNGSFRVPSATTPVDRMLESPLPSTRVNMSRGAVSGAGVDGAGAGPGTGDDNVTGGVNPAVSPSGTAAALTTATHSLRPVMRTAVVITPVPVTPPLVQPSEDNVRSVLTSDQAFEVCGLAR